MTPALRDEIEDRLLEDEAVASSTIDFVLAACDGDIALDRCIDSFADTSAPRATTERPKRLSRDAPAGAYLRRLEVSGFRGVGKPLELELSPGPGLTVVLGRNGSGKSSISEGLEALLTNTSSRWADRGKEWREGWRNLHHPDDRVYVEATFDVEGSASIVARRIWRDALDESELRVRRGNEKLAEGFAELAWEEPLETYRPFLSHRELSTVLDTPSRLYDPLKAILGLDEVQMATRRLSVAKKARDAEAKDLRAVKGALVADLEATDDDRARVCFAALKKRAVDVATLETVVFARDEDGPSVSSDLRRIAQLTAPDLDRIAEASSRLRSAIAWGADLDDQREAHAAALASLLEQALKFCAPQDEPGACPVCGAPLSAAWAEEARARLTDAQQASQRRAKVDAERKEASDSLRALITPVPALVNRLEPLGLPVDAATIWARFCRLPDRLDELADHAEREALALVEALEALREACRKRIEARDSVWSPLARRVAAFIEPARRAEAARPLVKALKDAKKWLDDAIASMRDERFAPIATHAQRLWRQLRQNSNVDLAGVRLEGTSTRRRVALDVAVDGTEGVALGVMSQGELNALALSLFLPRMTLGESPFHFVVIDDPVQAMDPLKVDGLATVLAEVAKARQVIVLTHDNRLYEAIRRLGIEARVLEVQRDLSSKVSLYELIEPVARHLRDATHCLRHRDGLGRDTVCDLVPTFCRLALEAACTEAYRRRRLERGDAHRDVEEALEDVQGLHDMMAASLDVESDQLYGHLNQHYGRNAADLLKRIKRAAHQAYQGDLEQLVRDVRDFAMRIRRAS